MLGNLGPGLALPASGAHIHEGTADVAGPVMVALSAPDESGISGGCTSADKELIKEIMQAMDAFYFNVHTSDYPAGAVRGQLGKQNDWTAKHAKKHA